MLAQELRRNRHLSTLEMSHNNASPEAMYEVVKLIHRNEDRKKKKLEKELLQEKKGAPASEEL